MLLLAGLGNPGPEHAGNRHNAGFMALDALAERYRFHRPRARFHGLLADGEIAGDKVLLFKPMLYMNRSGIALAEAVRFYKLPLDRVIVFHDEVDLEPGRLKVKRGGGNAGHNGLRSIDAHLGRDYRRVRLGVGHPGDKHKVVGYVLKDFSKAERVITKRLVDAAAEAAPLLVAGDDAAYMTRVALILNPPAVKPRPAADTDDGT